MQTFISETLDDILKSQRTFENCVFVLPSQRAGVFVRNELRNKLTKGFLPEIYTIENFAQKISGINTGDTIQLLFHFYKVYCEIEESPDAFDHFSSWASVVLQDFNEVDQYLVNSHDIFTYLRDIQRLRKWSVKGEFKETELIKDHMVFMERLGNYYHQFYEHLLYLKTGYQGLIYREATKKVAQYLSRHDVTRFYFIGFNALNKAEEFLIQSFLDSGRAEIYFDIDRSFFESNHSAGSFIRKYKTQWKYYEKRAFKLVSSHFSKPKNIQVIGTAKNVAQLKYTGQILNELDDYQNTALVLGDESLLSVGLNSIPTKVNAINITMGYPLKNIPTSNFITAVFQLFLTQEKLQKSSSHEFYYKDVLRFFKNPLIFQYIAAGNETFILNLQNIISQENRSFISIETLKSYVAKLDSTAQEPILGIFQPYKGIEDFINRILNFIEKSRDLVSSLEKEYLYRFYTAFTQLKTLNKTYGYFHEIKTLFQFYRRVIATEKMSFQGEPLRGLQMMGMLETRVLDFKNVIITSVNEGVIPANSNQNSFIPFDVKVQFGLPTYREKDAIFSYHFFRLLQRAENIFLLYNTENDSYGNGEKSRFITQLELLRDTIEHKTIAQQVITEKYPLLEINKHPQVLEKLKEFAETGISPSALGKYLYNPIEFYKQRVLGLHEVNEVEETVAANTLGTIVHDTLDEFYTPVQGQYLEITHLQFMKSKTKEVITKYFIKHFRNGDFKRGKNRLIFEVAQNYVHRFIELEMNQIKGGNQIRILATEQRLASQIQIQGMDFPIKIKGTVDRIDEFNGTTRIIDYKTGLVESKQLKVSGLKSLQDHKFEKAIQVLLYTHLYVSNLEEIPDNIQAGIYSFRNLNEGFIKINFSEEYRGKDNSITIEKLQSAMIEIVKIITEIFDPVYPFKEPEELPY
jgi:hypothetical protein